LGGVVKTSQPVFVGTANQNIAHIIVNRVAVKQSRIMRCFLWIASGFVFAKTVTIIEMKISETKSS
jgi:hypothetical protein